MPKNIHRKKKCLSQATDDLEIEFCQKRLNKKHGDKNAWYYGVRSKNKNRFCDNRTEPIISL